jgi:hypothetical protein
MLARPTNLLARPPIPLTVPVELRIFPGWGVSLSENRSR